MPDHGVNVVEEGTGIVDAVLTPRLAARFARALASDEEGRVREVAADTRRLRVGDGLFAVAMATDARAPRVATMRERGASDPATLRALAWAAHARGHEILAAGAGDAAASAGAAASVLDDPRLAGATAPVMLEVALEACTRNAAAAGTRATLQRVAEDVRAPGSANAETLARVALGVVALTPDLDGSVTRPQLAVGARIARARRAAAIRAARAAAIERAAAEARAAALANIEAARIVQRELTERKRGAALAAHERWEREERALVEERARLRHAEEVEQAAASLARAEAIAHERRLAQHAAQHEALLRAIDGAHERAEGRERDQQIAAAEARMRAEATAIEARYDVAGDAARRAHERALERAADGARAALAAFEAEVAQRRARIDVDTAAALAAADAVAARRIDVEVRAAGEAAARARGAEIDAELVELTGGGPR